MDRRIRNHLAQVNPHGYPSLCVADKQGQVVGDLVVGGDGNVVRVLRLWIDADVQYPEAIGGSLLEQFFDHLNKAGHSYRAMEVDVRETKVWWLNFWKQNGFVCLLNGVHNDCYEDSDDAIYRMTYTFERKRNIGRAVTH